MSEARPFPVWLRVLLNLLAIGGVGASVMGWVKPLVGCFVIVIFIALVYVIWEIAPWTTNQISKRPRMTFLVFVVVGASIGAGTWWMWRNAAGKQPEPLAAPVIWALPAPIVEGTPLSTMQLNAVSVIEGVFSYDPPAGTVLPVGTRSLTATFYARDSAKYMLHTETRSILVIPVTSSVSHATIPLKPAHFELREPGFKPLPNSPPFRLMIQMINTGGRSAYGLEYQIVMVDQKNHIVSHNESGSAGGEIPPNSPTPYYNDSIKFPLNMPAQFIILCLHYKDTEDSKTIKTQMFYMQWPGVINGTTSPDFTYVSIEQEKELKALMVSLLKVKKP